MSKLPILPLAFGFTFAVISGGFGQGMTYTANPTNNAANNTVGLPSQNANATGRPTPSTDDSTEQPDDPTLQRLKSSESLGAGSMSRDEGQLTAKMRRREKVSNVDSKQLHTSGTDPKFQGSLLQSSVSSIEHVGEKANAGEPVEAANAAAAAANKAAAPPEVIDESDPRFRARKLVFTPMTDDESNKKAMPRAAADSSPSPSPSASATPSSR